MKRNKSGLNSVSGIKIKFVYLAKKMRAYNKKMYQRSFLEKLLLEIL